MPAADCKDLPVGVVSSSTGTTVTTLDLAKGYYRTSGGSHIVLECYRKDSCIGGLDTSNYCAAGYEGPCKPTNERMLHGIYNFISTSHCCCGSQRGRMGGAGSVIQYQVPNNTVQSSPAIDEQSFDYRYIQYSVS